MVREYAMNSGTLRHCSFTEMLSNTPTSAAISSSARILAIPWIVKLACQYAGMALM